MKDFIYDMETQLATFSRYSKSACRRKPPKTAHGCSKGTREPRHTTSRFLSPDARVMARRESSTWRTEATPPFSRHGRHTCRRRSQLAALDCAKGVQLTEPWQHGNSMRDGRMLHFTPRRLAVGSAPTSGSAWTQTKLEAARTQQTLEGQDVHRWRRRRAARTAPTSTRYRMQQRYSSYSSFH